MRLFTRILNRLRFEKQRLANWLRTCWEACITLMVRTHVRRWEKVAQGGRPSWDERNEIIAGYIPAGSSILDVGCGAQTLKQHLKPGCRYQPSDVVKSTPEVIFCDFNANVYPDVKEKYDYVVCSGVLEYIREPEKFLRRIPPLGHSVILSYNPLLPGGSKLTRMGNGWGWVNHFTKEELQTLFGECGFFFKLLIDHEKGYSIYLLTQSGQISTMGGWTE